MEREGETEKERDGRQEWLTSLLKCFWDQPHCSVWVSKQEIAQESLNFWGGQIIPPRTRVIPFLYCSPRTSMLFPAAVGPGCPAYICLMSLYAPGVGLGIWHSVLCSSVHMCAYTCVCVVVWLHLPGGVCVRLCFSLCVYVYFCVCVCVRVGDGGGSWDVASCV